MGWFRRSQALLLVAALFATACDEEPTKGADAGTTSVDAGINTGIDVEFQKAVIAAATGTADTGDDERPPAGGVFPEGQADRFHAKDTPAKVTVVDEGSEPRVVFTPRLGEPVRVELSIVKGQPNPPLELALKLEIVDPSAKTADEPDPKKPTPKKPAPKKGAKALPAPEHPSGGPMLVATLLELKLKAPPDKVPDDVKKKVSSLVGSRIVASYAATGCFVKPNTELVDGADKELAAPLMRMVLEAVGHIVFPVPDKGIGVGGFWMVTDRAPGAAVDVVRYRVFTVKALEGKQAALSIDLTQYTSIEALNEAIPGGMQIGGFESKASGMSTRTAGAFVPTQIELQVPMKLLVPGPGGRAQPATVDVLDLKASVVTAPPPEDDKKKTP